MTSAEADNRLSRFIFCLAFVGFCFFEAMALRRPIFWLLGIVPDDAFYYLQVARHLAATGTSTFDGINPTNGYHPGWMLLMVACAKVTANRAMLLRLCLATASMFHLGASLLLIPVFRRFVGSFWAWIGAALWLINPFALFLALQGVEAALYIFTLVLIVAVYLAWIAPSLRKESVFAVPNRQLILFGICLGAAFWARTESLIFVFVTLIFLAIAIRCDTRMPEPSRVIARTLGCVGGVFIITISPWLLYSYLIVGRFSQNSGAMKMLWAAQRRPFYEPAQLIDFARFLRWNWLDVPVSIMLGNPKLALIVEIVLGLGLLLAICVVYEQLPKVPQQSAIQRSRPPLPSEERAEKGEGIRGEGEPGSQAQSGVERGALQNEFILLNVWLLTATLLTSVVYHLFLTDFQMWYSCLPAIVLFILAMIWAVLALQKLRWSRSRSIQLLFGGGMFVIVLLLFAKFTFKTPIPYPWQRAVYLSQRQFDPLIPPGARIGCFNAGIPAYFDQHTVINLDGLVNATVYPYWKRHQLDRYLADQQIDYIADEADALRRAQRFSANPIRLAVIASAPLPGWWTPRRYLWRVLK